MPRALFDTQADDARRPAVLPRSVWIAAAIAVALRMLLFAWGPMWDVERAMSADSHRYVELADNLVAHGTLGVEEEDAGAILIPLTALRAKHGELEARLDNGLRPDILRTPGYPLYLASFGMIGLPLQWAIVGQCLLAGLCVLLVYRIAMLLLKAQGGALIAAWLLAANPGDIVAANCLLTEYSFTFVLLLSVWLAVRAWHRNSLHDAGMSGIVIGISALVRPIGLLIGPAITLWMLAARRPTTRRIACALCVSLASMLPIAYWLQRNATIGHGPSLSCVGPFNNYFKNAAFIRITERGGDTYHDWEAIVPEMIDELDRENRANETLWQTMNRLAFADMQRRPGLFAVILADSYSKFLIAHSAPTLWRLVGSEYRPSGLRDHLLAGELRLPDGDQAVMLCAAVIGTGINAVLAMLTLAGFVLMLRRRQWAALLLLGGLFTYFLLATQIHGAERLRVPVIGLQGIAAARAIVAITRRRTAVVLAYSSEREPAQVTRPALAA